MKPSIRKLNNYFKLEVERGYDNNAVVGGLDRMLEHWESEARIDGLDEDLIQMVISRIRDYPRLSEYSRYEMLQGLWQRIQRDEQVPPIDFTTPQQEPERQEPTTDPGQILEEKEPAPSPPEEPETKITPDQPEPDQVEDETEAEPDRQSALEPTATEPIAMDAPVTVLPGVGPSNARILERLGLRTLRDMLYYFPRRYDDYSLMKPINRLTYGEELTVIGTVERVNVRKVRSGRSKIVEIILTDGSGALKVNWFNQIWVAKRMRVGMQISVSGKVEQYLGRLTMNNPEWEYLDQKQLNTQRIVPVYPLTANMTQRRLRRLMDQVVSYWAPRVLEPLPGELRESAQLVDLPTALKQVHFPDSWDEIEHARHRLAFDEIFLLQLGVLGQSRSWKSRPGRQFIVSDEWITEQLGRLPYTLTGAQHRSLVDIRQDLSSGSPMNRLIQGDVGSGKTVVAGLAVGMIVHTGAQAAIMAPTSILAEQHYANLVRMLCEGEKALLGPEQVRLLIGATPEGEKQEIRDGLENGHIKLLIGTHALIEDPVSFADLQFVVVDEQHRFGVTQRSALRAKGDTPHLLVMTATPIPRSLALTVYGDLDISVIDEMPPGRQPVSTHVMMPRELERAYSLIRSQIDQGNQAFIVYPLVEGSEHSQAKAAVEEYENLKQKVFPNLRVGLLHGRMKGEEKEEVMSQFRDGDYQILASTTVIEVGVDIPKANLILIEGANRFGLAQLHQLRGRVGRGADKAFCLLVPETIDDAENERLKVMTETVDGFVLAEKDLEMRGPGEFLGTRQSGFTELRMASLTDVRLIEKARRFAKMLFNQDPDLEQPKHQFISAALEQFWTQGEGDIS